MMFKSFTHEIKTPLNGVIQSMDLIYTILQKLTEKRKMLNQPFGDYNQI
jgi:hypothetical protein